VSLKGQRTEVKAETIRCRHASSRKAFCDTEDLKPPTEKRGRWEVSAEVRGIVERGGNCYWWEPRKGSPPYFKRRNAKKKGEPPP